VLAKHYALIQPFNAQAQSKDPSVHTLMTAPQGATLGFRPGSQGSKHRTNLYLQMHEGHLSRTLAAAHGFLVHVQGKLGCVSTSGTQICVNTLAIHCPSLLQPPLLRKIISAHKLIIP